MSTSDTVRRTLRLRRVDSAAAAARVRHVDELSEEALARFVELIESGSTAAVDEATFADGEVIVFTDYYRVDLS
ncbi:hypothetical protein [Salinilacihabitans rarus]|uniref:hypothetical protein n=1 Tax=Salinilacihabitans rarus TaxID=2961596 RepID=UPI0020C8469E|nr:hypothetical protein [Salinilacihabitans rarus]